MEYHVSHPSLTDGNTAPMTFLTLPKANHTNLNGPPRGFFGFVTEGFFSGFFLARSTKNFVDLKIDPLLASQGMGECRPPLGFLKRISGRTPFTIPTICTPNDLAGFQVT